MKKKQGAESFGVIGLGRFGTALAITIAKAGKDVIVIDRNEAKVKELRQYTDYAFVVDELNADSLREVGIQNCDTVIVCIGEKMDTSILTTMCVVEMGIPHVIAKALTAEQGAVLEKLGGEYSALGDTLFSGRVKDAFIRLRVAHIFWLDSLGA